MRPTSARRLPVLWGTAAALVGLTLPVMLVVCFAWFLIGGVLAGVRDRVQVVVFAYEYGIIRTGAPDPNA